MAPSSDCASHLVRISWRKQHDATPTHLSEDMSTEEGSSCDGQTQISINAAKSQTRPTNVGMEMHDLR